jgi:ketosteroid isomerase-like protein
MSEENVDAFKRGIDAYNRQDIEALLEGVDPDVEWLPAILTGLEGEATVYRGHEGLREGLRDLYEALGETHLEYPEIRDLGDRIVGIGRIRTRGRESGAETSRPMPW